MGYYINPKAGSKESFLRNNAVALDEAPSADDIDWQKKDVLPVCLVDNGMFNAAGIAYSPGELEAFDLPDDDRPKSWFLIETKLLGKEAGLDPKHCPW